MAFLGFGFADLFFCELVVTSGEDVAAAEPPVFTDSELFESFKKIPRPLLQLTAPFLEEIISYLPVPAFAKVRFHSDNSL